MDELGSISLSERTARNTARRKAAFVAIEADLLEYARTHGGRYLVYGSAARGEVRADSDYDLLIDFPGDREAEAWRFAEQVCASHGVPLDARLRSWTTEDFASRIETVAKVLQ